MARGTFGLTSSRRARGVSYRGGSYRGGNNVRGGSTQRVRRGDSTTSSTLIKREDDGTKLAEKFEEVALKDEIDEKLGFARIQEGPRKEAWLVNMHPVSVVIQCNVYPIIMCADSGQRSRLSLRDCRL